MIIIIKNIDSLINAINEIVDKQNNKNQVIKEFQEHYESVNALIKTEELLAGKLGDIPEALVYKVVKALNVKNYKEYFTDDKIEYNEVLTRVVKLENRVDNLENEFKIIKKIKRSE